MEVSVAVLGQPVKPYVCQSVFAVKSPNLMSTECTAPTVNEMAKMEH